ncbi:PAS domain S-box protein [Pantanalinema sp. GBBB05]|uniref:PAS domain S-box protein n=1 Tax=Pantanalinema sp. GBBB05 TaxID=2604139 RepID=UPI001DB865E9|nr:PAS domain S-box protein [Pantanalinema sp. GBBB05]
MSIDSAPTQLSCEVILESISEITCQIHQGWELEDILQAGITQARAILQTDRVLLYRFLPNQDAVVAFESVGSGWTSIIGQLIYDPCFNATWVERYQQGQVTSIADIHNGSIAPCHAQLLAQLQVQANLVVPIVRQGQLWGLLIAHHCRSPRQWQPLEVQYLQQLALHLSIAIQQATLQQRQSDYEQTLNSEHLRDRYERIVAVAPDGIALIDRNYVYQVVNPTYLTWHQKSHNEMIGQSMGQLYGQEFFASFVKPPIDLCLAGSPKQSLETWLNYGDGQRHFIRTTFVPYRERDGAISGVVINVNDLTEQKRVEAALRESEARFRVMSDSAPVLLWMSDVDGLCNFFNQTWLTFTGRTLIQEMGNGWADGVHPDDLQSCLETYLMAVQTRQPFEMEYRLRRADGEYRWVLDRGTPRFTPDHELVGFIGSCIDIHERKQLETSLWLANLSLEHLGVSATWIDRHAQIRRVNATICAALGYSREELQTMTLEQIDPNFSQTDWAQVWALIKQQQHLTLISQHRTKAGELIPVEVTVRYVEFAGEEYSFAIAKDIRERLQTEDQLRLQSTALTACADAIMITDHHGRIEWVNSAFTAMTGYSLEEAIGTCPSKLLQSGQQDCAFYQSLWTTILAGQPWRGEIINRRKDGSLYIESETITPVFDHHQRISHFIAIKQDATERKQLEQIERRRIEQERVLHQISQQMRQSLDLHQVLNTVVTEVQQFLHTDRVIIYRLNLDWTGVVIAESVAPGWLAIQPIAMTGTDFAETHGEIYHTNYINVMPDIYAVGFSSCHIAMLERLQIRAKLVVPILCANQTWGLLVAHQCGSARQWQPLECEFMTQLAARMEIAIQQSELYQQMQILNINLESQVQERTAQLQQALDFDVILKRITDQVRDSLDEEIILQQVVKELTTAMQADCCDTSKYDAERTFTTVEWEYNRDGFTAKNLVYAIADSSDPHLYVQLFQGQYCHFCLIDSNVIRPEQPRQTILAVPIVDNQGIMGDLWLFKSCHEGFNEPEIRLVQQVANQCAIALRQSRLYQAAQAQVQELERLNQLKDDFLSTVSHELRTPISNIKLATQMLEISLKGLGIVVDESSPINRYFKVLHEEGQREINLINDLLDLARLDTEIELLRMASVDLQFYLSHLAEGFIEQAQQQFVIQIAADLPPLLTDLSYLRRILTELLHNACKYTPAGETITVSAHPAPAGLEICVSNSGVEIPPIECDRIFDKFYRIPNHDPWKHSGTGLGLALVKKLTERLGGTIHVESSVGRTTFILRFSLVA